MAALMAPGAPDEAQSYLRRHGSFFPQADLHSSGPAVKQLQRLPRKAPKLSLHIGMRRTRISICCLTGWVQGGCACQTCHRIGGVRHKGVLGWDHRLAQHRHLQRAVRQPRPAQAQHRALVPLGRPDLLYGVPGVLPLAHPPMQALRHSTGLSLAPTAYKVIV